MKKYYALSIMNDYSKLKFIKFNLKSPLENGKYSIYDIFINEKKNILYKKKKKIKK